MGSSHLLQLKKGVIIFILSVYLLCFTHAEITHIVKNGVIVKNDDKIYFLDLEYRYYSPKD